MSKVSIIFLKCTGVAIILEVELWKIKIWNIIPFEIIILALEEESQWNTTCACQNFSLPMHCNQSYLCRKLSFVPFRQKLVTNCWDPKDRLYMIRTKWSLQNEVESKGCQCTAIKASDHIVISSHFSFHANVRQKCFPEIHEAAGV